MTSIYRTAYPRFSQNQKLKELATDYAFTKEELDYIKQNIRSDNLRLGFGVLLKVFQHLSAIVVEDTKIKIIENEIRTLGFKYFGAASRNTDFEFHGYEIHKGKGRYFLK